MPRPFRPAIVASLLLGLLAPLGIALAAAPDAASPADQAMAHGMATMQQQMQAAPLNGAPDHDFVVMMMPHHVGAIDMAKIELRDGKDPELKRMARSIVADQQREITQMQAWLASHPKQ